MEIIAPLALYIVLAVTLFYVLYTVIRAGVRDGILAADQRRGTGLDAPSASSSEATR